MSEAASPSGYGSTLCTRCERRTRMSMRMRMSTALKNQNDSSAPLRRSVRHGNSPCCCALPRVRLRPWHRHRCATCCCGSARQQQEGECDCACWLLRLPAAQGGGGGPCSEVGWRQVHLSGLRLYRRCVECGGVKESRTRCSVWRETQQSTTPPCAPPFFLRRSGPGQGALLVQVPRLRRGQEQVQAGGRGWCVLLLAQRNSSAFPAAPHTTTV
jgi:hypothetical protein